MADHFWAGVAVGICICGLAACAASCEEKPEEPVDFCKLEKTVILTAEERRILCGPIELKGMP